MRALRQIQSHESTLLSAPTPISCIESAIENPVFGADTYEVSGVVTWSTDLLPIVEVGVMSTQTEGL